MNILWDRLTAGRQTVADDVVKHVYTLEQLQAGVSLATDKRHLIVIRTPQLIVRLLANPSTLSGVDFPDKIRPELPVTMPWNG